MQKYDKNNGTNTIRIILVEIAFESTVPFGDGTGEGESGEEFRERPGRR